MIIGFTRNIFNGTASSEELHNYYVRTIEPILTRIQEEFQRKKKQRGTKEYKCNTPEVQKKLRYKCKQGDKEREKFSLENPPL